MCFSLFKAINNDVATVRQGSTDNVNTVSSDIVTGTFSSSWFVPLDYTLQWRSRHYSNSSSNKLIQIIDFEGRITGSREGGGLSFWKLTSRWNANAKQRGIMVRHRDLTCKFCIKCQWTGYSTDCNWTLVAVIVSYSTDREKILLVDHSLLRRPLRLGPSELALHLLEEGRQQLVDRLESFAIAFLCERDVVEHVVVRNGPVNLQVCSVHALQRTGRLVKVVGTCTKPVSMLTSWTRLFPLT